MSAIIDVQNLSFAYPKGKQVLEHLSFRVDAQERVALLGSNGAGKTTLIRLIVGLLRPTGGSVSTLGANPQTSPATRGQLGVAHQSSAAEEFLTGWTNLEIHGRFFGLTPQAVHNRVAELCELLGETPFLTQQVMGLSGGQRRRIQLLKALINRPRLLVLDEPTVGLDLESRGRFYAALDALQVKDGFTVLWTSHQFDEIERTCTRAIILKDGRVGYDHAILERDAAERVLKVRLHLRDAHTNRAIAPSLTSINEQQLLFVGERSKFYAEILPDVTARFGLTNLEIVRPSLEEVYLEITNRETEVPVWASQLFSAVNG